ncbi:tRNA-splicing endonuclease subunit Sen54-like isoform X6 [Clinocottus analis]|uniref:tRNA-splicing endonuclease subunit Sen54-like isoform X6 n=1 Tax=Clinocottus analis TaxID=304258 RepID=UPI0035C24E53
MADQNKKDAEPKFYNEILTKMTKRPCHSPSELFAVRSCSRKILVRGQKDFFLDDSDKQRWQLEKSLNEHWSLISEERVKKLGNLVKATWIPSERTVELQSPALPLFCCQDERRYVFFNDVKKKKEQPV